MEQPITQGLGYVTWLLRVIIDGMKMTLNVWGYEFSLWEVFVFSIVVYLVCSLIGGVING